MIRLFSRISDSVTIALNESPVVKPTTESTFGGVSTTFVTPRMIVGSGEPFFSVRDPSGAELLSVRGQTGSYIRSPLFRDYENRIDLLEGRVRTLIERQNRSNAIFIIFMLIFIAYSFVVNYSLLPYVLIFVVLVLFYKFMYDNLLN